MPTIRLGLLVSFARLENSLPTERDDSDDWFRLWVFFLFPAALLLLNGALGCTPYAYFEAITDMRETSRRRAFTSARESMDNGARGVHQTDMRETSRRRASESVDRRLSALAGLRTRT